MSFILDALRKSEHARQKQTGPGLAEVPVVAPRSKSNVWATAAIALLVVNLVAVGVLLLRRASQDDEAASATTAAASGAPATAATTAASPSTPAAAPDAASSHSATGPTLAPPVATSPPAGAPAEGAGNPLAAEVGGVEADVEPSQAAAAASVPTGPPAVTRQPADAPRRGSVVYAPIPEAADAPTASAGDAASSPATDSLPSADDVAARGGLPPLHLDLHVYSNQPQQRFVFVNSRKYREGETLQEGPVIEQITPDGAVLNFRGSRFKLSND